MMLAPIRILFCAYQCKQTIDHNIASDRDTEK